MLDRSGFDELNMVENPMVYYNDGNKWNLKGDNLCWATKEQVDEQKQWLKRFARQDKMRIYIKEVNTSHVTLNTFSPNLFVNKKENFFRRIITSIKYIFKEKV